MEITLTEPMVTVNIGVEYDCVLPPFIPIENLNINRIKSTE
jgi:hypothetical protein